MPRSLFLAALAAPIVVLSFWSAAAASPARDGVVVNARGTPLAGVRVFVHTSRGIIFDSNQHIWDRRTDAKGRYQHRSKYRHEATYAAAPGFYPGVADAKGRILLNKVPATAQRVCDGSIEARADGALFGFDFTSGRRAPIDQADLIPVDVNIAKQRIGMAATGRGALVLIPRLDSRPSWPRAMCAFLNATTPPGHDAKGWCPRVAKWNVGPVFLRLRDGKRHAKIIASRSEASADGTSLVVHFRYVVQAKNAKHVGSVWTVGDFVKMLPSGTWHR